MTSKELSEGLGVQLFCGDCFDILPKIPDQSIDCIIIDPPFNITAASWDQEAVDLERLWKEFERIVKLDRAICVFSNQPFTSRLVVSNPRNYRYDWLWNKHIPRNFANAKRMPMTKHETISVFSYGSKYPRYFPQMVEREKPVKYKNYSKRKDSSYIINRQKDETPRVSTHRYPDSIIEGLWEANAGKLHPNSKPVSLMEYLINTYTEPGEVVLDCFAGAMPVAVACLKQGRGVVSIERDPEYFEIGKKRIEECLMSLDL